MLCLQHSCNRFLIGVMETSMKRQPVCTTAVGDVCGRDCPCSSWVFYTTTGRFWTWSEKKRSTTICAKTASISWGFRSLLIVSGMWRSRPDTTTMADFTKKPFHHILPHDFPPYTTVANFYYAAIRSGLWVKIRAALVERVRRDAGRAAGPSYAIIDSQSVKTAFSGEERGIDGGKKQKDANGTS